jgi:hypothetical protein
MLGKVSAVYCSAASIKDIGVKEDVLVALHPV